MRNMKLEDDRLHGPHGEYIESKFRKLFEAIMKLKEESEEGDRLLRKQMTCDHLEFDYTYRAMAYDKECKRCGLYMGAVHPKEKAEEELAAAKAKVARMEKAVKPTCDSKNELLKYRLDDALQRSHHTKAYAVALKQLQDEIAEIIKG